MSDVPELDAAGLPEELSAVDQILHRGEANPRTRSGIMGCRAARQPPRTGSASGRGSSNASRKVLRLRQKVVMPTLPTAAPRWVVDPDFNLDFHVRRVRVPEPGTLRQVFDLAEIAAAVAAGHLPAAVDRDPRRGARRRPRRLNGAPQPRRRPTGSAASRCSPTSTT